MCAPEVSEGTPNVRTFRHHHAELRQLAEWLLEQGVESVAMESTNVYWIPLYELLESCGIEVVLVNARQLRYVPGRKTDLQDCQWIQLLHSCGLLRGSFRPHEVIVRETQDAAPATEQSGEGKHPFRPVDAEGAGSDERPGASCGQRPDRSDGDGDRAGDCLGRTGPGRSGGSASYAVQEIQPGVCRAGRQLAGGAFVQPSWCALELFDMTQRKIAVYEAAFWRNTGAGNRWKPATSRCPPTPMGSRKGRFAGVAGKPMRTELWRFAGVDLTRIDGIGTEAALTLLTEVGFEH